MIPASPAAAPNSVAHYLSPSTLIANLWSWRTLLGQLIRRELATRYRGAVLGIIWSFLLPLAMLVIYTFVFSIVFQARFDVKVSNSKAEFALMLFAGIILWTIFVESVGAAPMAVVTQPNYVKKVVFPLEILPVVRLGAGLVHAGISVGILLTAELIFMRTLPTSIVLLPLILLPLIMLVLGISWFLASLNVYIRDVAQIVGVVLNILFFLTPIFYPLSQVPPAFRAIMRLNPLAVIVESGRRALLGGAAPDWAGLGIATLFSAVVMQLGYVWFMKTKRGFADVL